MSQTVPTSTRPVAVHQLIELLQTPANGAPLEILTIGRLDAPELTTLRSLPGVRFHDWSADRALAGCADDDRSDDRQALDRQPAPLAPGRGRDDDLADDRQAQGSNSQETPWSTCLRAPIGVGATSGADDASPDLIAVEAPTLLLELARAGWGPLRGCLGLIVRAELAPRQPRVPGFGEIDCRLRAAGLRLHSLRRLGHDHLADAPVPAVAQVTVADACYLIGPRARARLPVERQVQLALLTCALGAQDQAWLALQRYDAANGSRCAAEFAALARADDPPAPVLRAVDPDAAAGAAVSVAAHLGGAAAAPAAGAVVDAAANASPASSPVPEPIAGGSAPGGPGVGHAERGNCARIRIRGGVTVSVPATVALMTPYILWEQEDWFEDELGFVRDLLEPGMQVLDIGANYGVYTLPMAAAIGNGGRLWAIEPAPATMAYLRRSLAGNGLVQCEALEVALSDHAGEAQLRIGANAELNTLNADRSDASTCTVWLQTLGALYREIGSPAIDFVKLDAEGEELRIIAGAADFFHDTGALILYELKHGAQANLSLVEAFAACGLRSYRLVPGLGIIVPFDTRAAVDPYLLNLFACRDATAAKLAARGLLVPWPVAAANAAPALVGSGAEATPDPPVAWEQALAALPFATDLMSGWQQRSPRAGDGRYVAALNLWLSARDPAAPAAHRLAWLRRCCNLLTALMAEQPRLPRRLTYARVLLDLGERRAGVAALVALRTDLADPQHPFALDEPFVPPCPRYEAIAPGDAHHPWCLSAVLEQWDRSRAFSTYFIGPAALPALNAIVALGFAGAEVERRRQLVRLRAGLQAAVEASPLLQCDTPEHLNAAAWRQPHVRMDQDAREESPAQRDPPARQRPVRRQPSAQRLLLAAGMPRSGSTWLYNAARILLRQTDGGEATLTAGWIKDWPQLPSRPRTLIKLHDFDAGIVARAHCILYSFRDLRDALASMARKFGATPSLALADRFVAADRRWQAVAGFRMRYESMIADPTATLAAIAQALEITDPDLAAASAQLAQLAGGPTSAPTAGYDPDTLLHPGHITDGRHGTWAGVIPAPALGAIEARHRDWFQTHGYALA